MGKVRIEFPLFIKNGSSDSEPLMQQTLLGILALIVVANFSLNQKRDVIRTYSELVDDEMEVAASGVAMHVLELISNRSFDSRTTPTQVHELGMVGGTTSLTTKSAFGSQTNCDLDEPFKDYIPCLDIDDADMADDEWQETPFRMRYGKELPFDVQVQVFYVDPSDLDTHLPAGQKSFHKKVVVKVRSKHHVKQNRYPDGFVRLERIFSYNETRADNRLREKYGDPVVVDPVIEPTVEPIEEPTVEPDPDEYVTICHRRVRDGKVTWKTKTVKQKYIARHIGHGDTLGSC